MQPEEWLPVPGWEGLYEISSTGRIKTLPRVVPHWRGGVSTRPERFMALRPDKDGYLQVTFKRPGVSEHFRVHRLVALAFLGRPPEGKTWALHRDGNVANNSSSNLYWGDQADNEQDKIRHGTHQETRKTHCTQGHPYSKENTYIPPQTTYRQCRICRRQRVREAQDRRKGKS